MAGKKNARTKRQTRRKATSAAAAAGVAPLSAEELLRDLPAFGELAPTEEQRRAFEEARAEAGEGVCLELGCVVRLDRGFPLVATGKRVERAEHAAAFAKQDAEKAEVLYPAVGDWVALSCPEGHEMGVIERVLPRRTEFARWRGGNRGERQVLAANVERVLIVQALSARPVPTGRIVRSAVLARDCGIEPAVVLTKADRKASAEDLAADVAKVKRLLGEECRVVVTSSLEGEGLEAVRSTVPAGCVAMILGESGAGKSTLLNALLGHEALATGDVRARDDAGRHTTVCRMMIGIPEAGTIIDVPGLRNLPLVGHERGLALMFPEVVRAARGCRFNDCTHDHEPGCEVRAGVEAGEIDPARLEAFAALASELRVSAQSLDPDVTLR